MEYLIYAAYGSNLLKKRFMYYIEGGTYRGKEYKGSCDKTEPIDLGFMLIPYRLYFAKRSPRWDNKGVAFISCETEPDKEYHTVVRLWKVSRIQFDDIHEQEGKGWYNVKLYLGNMGGMKIYTFTGCWKDEENSPSEEYLNVIKKGLKETTNWSDEEIENYLEKRKPNK
ncbi:MAG: hypothetical protein ACK4VK_05285 [Aquificaceae bacterium]